MKQGIYSALQYRIEIVRVDGLSHPWRVYVSRPETGERHQI